LFGTSLKYEATRVSIIRAVTTTDNDMPESKGFLEDTEGEQEAEEEFDEFDSGSDGWKVDEVITDHKLASGSKCFFGNSKFNMPNKLTVSPADWLLYFLPVDLIKDVVIPNTESHARNVNHN
jgi:hypothetical protein